MNTNFELLACDEVKEFCEVTTSFFWCEDVILQTKENIAVNFETIKGVRRTYVGLTRTIFLFTSLRGEIGGTTPEAFPTNTMVPFLRMTSKSISYLT